MWNRDNNEMPSVDELMDHTLILPDYEEEWNQLWFEATYDTYGAMLNAHLEANHRRFPPSGSNELRSLK